MGRPVPLPTGTGRFRARAATGDLITELSKAEQARQHIQKIGVGIAAAGAGIAAGLALATHQAIEWESAWAGVVKTVDGSEAQLAALEAELRDIAGELPATHTEIAAVAEAAGQLGVATEDVADFTRTMLHLGEATNLTAEEAAVALAQLSNILGTAPDDVDRLGAAIVDLGNNSATTEADIVAMAQRIAGAGATIGLSEADVLGFSAALASVGINAEAGGSAISRAMISIEGSVREGGAALDTIAEVAGVSAAQFQQAYERDAAAAISTFVAGLGQMQQSGQDVFAVLDQLGFSEIRLRDALLRLSSAGDLLTDSLDTGATAWDENIALLAEAERRYATTEARIGIARNQLNDFAIDMGSTFLPAVGEMADRIAAAAEMFADLPGPVKATAAVVAALAAGVLLAAGAALVAVPRIAAMGPALDTIAASGVRAAAAVGLLRTATTTMGSFLMGPWGLAIGIGIAAVGAFAAAQAAARAEAREFRDTLDDQTGAVTRNTRVLVARKLHEEGAIEAAERHGISVAELVDAVLGEEAALKRLNDVTRESATVTEIHGQGITKVSGEMVGVQGTVESLSGALAQSSEDWRIEQEAMESAALTAQDLEPAHRDLAAAFGVTAAAAGDVAGAVDQLDEELEQLFGRIFGLTNAQDDLADAFDRMSDQIQRQREEGVAGAGALDGMTEAARNNRDAAQDILELYGQLTLETIKATGSTEEAAAVAEDFEKALDDLEEQTGVNIREMEGYNEVVDEIDRLIAVTFNTPGVQDAIEAAERLRAQLDLIDRTVTVSFNTQGFAPVGGVNIPQRHGGITMHARDGLLRSAAVFSPQAPARFAFAEPETGGEAFIPRFGDRQRSLAIADVAAGWHGGRVVAGDSAAALGGPFQWRAARQAGPPSGGAQGGVTVEQQDIHVQAWSDRFSYQQVMNEIAMNIAA